MKLLLVVVPLVLALPSIALADHIGLYSDASGSSCQLATGFNPGITVIHKFSLGAIGSHFGVTFPAGSTVFAFSCSSCPITATSIPDATPLYGECVTGSFVIGTITAVLNPGYVRIVAATGVECAMYTDCSFVERAAYTGIGYAGVPNSCGEVVAEMSTGAASCPTVATEPSTWGSVKALYH
jgi:hypothetical protein